LEERIAELEATTARKGNRKVSLTISGWVGQQVMWWDNDFTGRNDVYVHDLGTTLGTHFKMTGQATIMPGFYAGYVIHVETMGSDSLTHNDDTATGPALYNLINSIHSHPAGGQGPGPGAAAAVTWGLGVQTLQAFWFVKSDHLGKVSVGLQSQASDNTAILVDGSGSLVPANWVAFDYRAFTFSTGIIGGASCGTMGGAIGDCNGLTQNAVRYDSPTWSGFSVSASWGADDFWDIAARYAGEHHGLKVSVAAAYNEVDDPNFNNLGALDADYFQVGAYVQHMHSGIWGLINYGKFDPTGGVESDTWYFKAGLRRRWHPLGHTVLYGEYEYVEDAYGLVGGNFDLWGVGVVQEIDAAAMSMWLKYRDIEGNGPDDEFRYVGLGALINF
jgi:hypothetical protein